MRRLALAVLCVVLVPSCKTDPDDNDNDLQRDASVPTTALRANLKNAVLIGIVAEDVDTGQQASMKDRDGVLKEGGELPLCEYLTVAELLEVDNLGAYVYLCESPDPLSFCQDISPEKLATGRVECTVRPWVVGDLVGVDTNGEVFSVLPTLPSWNRVTKIQQSEEALLVTLALPVKLTMSDESTDYCHVFYYLIDTTSDSIVPYCYEYEYMTVFCFGPRQVGDWPDPEWGYLVPEDGQDRDYRELYQDFTPESPEFCVEGMMHYGDWYFPRGGIHVTPHALYEPFWLNNDIVNGDFTRIVTGDQAAVYPMGIDVYTKNGIISGLEYYTFDASHVSISGPMSGVPLGWTGSLATKWAFESGSKILYGFPPPSSGVYGSWTGPHDATEVTLTFFDFEALEDGSFVIDISPHPGAGDPASQDPIIAFVAFLGDYLFLSEQGTGHLYRVDTQSIPLTIELALANANAYMVTHDRTVVMNGWAVNYSTRHQTDAGRPFVAYLFKPDGSVTEVNADMLGFNPQNIELTDDQMVVTGMDGLTPRRFVINPLATTDGELLVETPTETIPVKTLIPLQ